MSTRDQRPIRYVPTGKYANTKNFQLPLKNFMYHDESGQLRKVVYIPDADHIFAHLYKGDAKPQPVWFTDGQLLVRPTDKRLLHILNIHPWKNQYYKKFDERESALEKLSHNQLVKQALRLIDQADVDKMKATAFSVLDNYSFAMDEKIMQAALEEKAFNDPKWLITELTDPNFITKQMAALSVLKGILKINDSRTAITWPNGKILVSVPPGQDAIRRLGEYLAENTVEAKTTLQELGELNKPFRREKGPDLGEMIKQQADSKDVDDEDDDIDNEDLENIEVNEDKDDQENEDGDQYDSMELEDIIEVYQLTLGKNAPHNKRKDREWLIKKIKEVGAVPAEQ